MLFDSNVLIAASVSTHAHHRESSALLEINAPEYLMAAACLNETYNTLTRPLPRYAFPPQAAQAVIADFALRFRIVSMTAADNVAAIRRFAHAGGTGAQLYDYLIGATGEAFGADTIVTWNVRHFDRLFSHLRIVTPAELAA